MMSLKKIRFSKIKSRFRVFLKFLGISTLFLLAAALTLIVFVLLAAGELKSLVAFYPELTGYPNSERHYLILFQNNQELRPTGGFISAYGILSFRDGRLANLEIHDSYDKINQISAPAPYPLDRLLAGPSYPGHGFRDANFNPDFPTAAKDLEYFFQRAYPQFPLSGVIALNLQLIEDLLGIIGPVNVDGIIFNQKNLFAKLEEAVSNIDLHNLDQINDRKTVLRKFAKQLIKELPLSISSLPRLKNLLIKELNQKQILLYSKHPLLEKLIRRQNWDGHLEKREGDYLAIVESNLGGMKSDRYISRAIHYTVDISDEIFADQTRKARSELEIRFRHHGTENIPLSGWYQGWIRTFIPQGSTLLQRQIFDQNSQSIDLYDAKALPPNYTETENGLLGLGDRIIFQPSEERLIKYQYELPAGTITDQTYILNLRKQPGTLADYYDIVVKVPQGRALSSRDFDIREDRAFFRGFLTQDRRLTLTILGDFYGPRIINQEIPALNQLKVYFNEPVAPDPTYEINITDTNRKNPDQTDQIQVIKLSFPDERILEIATQGMTNQGLEHYQIVLKNIRDRYGNVINPNPRQITAVHR